MAGALGERLHATEAREEALRRSQQELAAALGERTRELEERGGLTLTPNPNPSRSPSPNPNPNPNPNLSKAAKNAIADIAE